MRKSFYGIVFVLLFLSNGCLSIDYSLIQDQPFYLKTTQELPHLNPETLPKIEPNPLSMGVAKVQLTHPDGIHLAGYGKRRNKKSTGTHDPVFIRAMAVRSGQKTWVLVNSDLLAVSNEIYQAVLEKVNYEIPLKPVDLMITATHTHSGPGGLSGKFWERFATGSYHAEFSETMKNQMTQVVVEAVQNLSPARYRTGRAEALDLIKNRMIEGGPVDPEVGIIEFQTLDGSQRAFIVNFSAHATVLGRDNLKVSGDYPGAFEAYLEENTPAIALFTAGTVGDQTAHAPEVDGEDPEDISFGRVDAMGKILAERTLNTISDRPWVGCGGVDSLRVPFYLPPSQVRVSKNFRLPSFFGDLFFDSASSLQAFRLGDQILLGVPADLSSEIGIKLKEYAETLGKRLLVLGFANDYVGYIIPQGNYKEGTYAGKMSFNGPHMGQYFQYVASKMIDVLHERAMEPCK